MFGVLKGAACSLEPGLRRQWTAHQCGMCRALGDRHGLLSRLATNYDAALLSVLYAAQAAEPPPTRRSYCPLRSPHRADTVAPDSPGAQYAASVALMMASTRIRDHVGDRQGSSRLARPLAMGISNRWLRAARQAAAGLGFDAAIIEDQVRRQAAAEARPGQDFASYAGPTELAAAAAFGHTAVLANRAGNVDVLREMGRMFGRIVVLLDSYQDYAADLKARGFNALAAAFPAGEWEQQASRLFHHAYSTLRNGFYRLELPNPALADALLVRQLKKRGHRALHLCDSGAAGCHPLGARSAARRSGALHAASGHGRDERQTGHEQEESAGWEEELDQLGLDEAYERQPEHEDEPPDGQEEPEQPVRGRARARGADSCYPANWLICCDCHDCDCDGCGCCDGDGCNCCDCDSCNCCEGDCCNCCEGGDCCNCCEGGDCCNC